MRLVDSHCHLQAVPFRDDVDAVVQAARAGGVERILVPGWNAGSAGEALALADRIAGLDVAVGIHPHDASQSDAAARREIERLVADPRVVAVGETGLDYDRRFSPIEAQLDNLRFHLALAREIGRPVILHCRSVAGRRDAQDALLAELDAAAMAGGDRPRAVIHSYSGPPDYGRELIRRGFSLSFSGLVFRRGEEVSAEVAAQVPPDRLLVETDAPYLSPPGAPRRRNEPAWVRVTGEWVAAQRGAAIDDLGAALVASYEVAFDRD